MITTETKKIQEIREEKRKVVLPRYIQQDKIKVIVGMGKSRIKAGAKEILHTFLEEFRESEMYDVILRQIGVEEEYGVEPVVMVYIPGMGSVKYKEVTQEIAKQIVDKHILKREILKEYVHRTPLEMNG